MKIHLASSLPKKERNSMTNSKNIKRPNKKGNKWVAIKKVFKFLYSIGLLILSDSHGPNITIASFIEVTRGLVVNGMIIPPIIIGSQTKETEKDPHPVSGLSFFKHRSMPTIVHNNKTSHNKAGSEQAKR